MPPQPRRDDSLPPAREAVRLGAFARGLGCGVGIERSCKLSPGRAQADRFLLSYGADERTARLTERLLDELAFAPEAREAFAADAARARFLHLGYEGGAFPVVKAYCEAGPHGPGPLYTAYKASPSKPGAFAIDDYRARNVAGAAAAWQAAREALADSVLSQPCEALLKRAGEGGAPVLLLEVSRRGSARRSFDLRIYDAGLCVGDAAALIGAARGAFDLTLDAVRPLADAAAQQLGHLAVGHDDDGSPFLTLYWGAEDFA